MKLLSSLPRSRTELVNRVRRLSSSSTIQSAFWVVLGSGGQQFIRLAGNLILTRLLFPEVFGIMAIVTAVMVGLELLSDVGLREGVVNSDRIADPHFMSTAWTIQVVRAGLIGLLAVAIAFPLAHIYDEPLLMPILACTGLITFLTGFKSITLLAYDKRLELKMQVYVDLGVQVAGLIVTVSVAWWFRSIWAMIFGHLTAAIVLVILSYTRFKGHFSRFNWEKSTVHQLFTFGKWIFLSSAISYLALQGDRLVMGGFMSMGELGKYAVASTWAGMIMILAGTLSGRVLHPYFRQALDTHADHSTIHKVRNTLNAIYTTVCLCLALVGEHLIIFLYDERYAEAGWILQVLALGQVGRSLTATLQPFMLAQGDSFSQMKFSAANAAILISFICLGGWLAGTVGVIVAYALSNLTAHPVMVMFARRHGYYCLFEDLGLIVVAISFCVLMWWLIDAPALAMLLSLGTGT